MLKVWKKIKNLYPVLCQEIIKKVKIKNKKAKEAILKNNNKGQNLNLPLGLEKDSM